MFRRRRRIFSTVLLIGVSCFLNSFARAQDVTSGTDAQKKVNLSPANWPVGELEKHNQLNLEFGNKQTLATSDQAVITGTTSSSAIRAGLEALNLGGSAADAVLTTSLTQISLAQGAWVSYAGIITMVYYDVESDQVYCMNGGYNTILGEDDPMTIPNKESGRTALVPGYMAGVESAHQRFGKLPFKEIFAPAIHYAENGFEINTLNNSMMHRRVNVLSRLPETKNVFLNKATGEFYETGELFKQPELAKTLRKVSENGADYMYNGEWSKTLVAMVQADGGKMIEEDIRRYRVLWTNPLRIKYGDHQVFAPGLPAQGGVHIAESLNLCTEANLKGMGHYTESPESFFWMSQFNTVFALSFIPPTTQKMMFGRETPMEFRRTPKFAKEMWPKMKQGQLPMLQTPDSLGDNHSDAVVAIDRWGNVAALVHTINTSAWGETGLFVDGVSIPDSAGAQQALISRTGPGQRLPDPMEPLIIMHNGKPVAALSSIGAGLHARTMTSLTSIIDYEQDLQVAIESPSMHLPEFGAAGQPTQQIFAGEFSDELVEGIKKLGLRIKVHPSDISSRAPRGYVIGASIDGKTGRRSAVSTQMFNGAAMGQK